MQLQTNSFLSALRCENEGRPPVWLMRQAGRSLPQYRELRKQHSLWQLFHEPELAAQVTIQPVDILGVDAAILFSDILVIAESFGLKVHFPEGKTPFTDFSDNLIFQNVTENLSYVSKTIELLKKQLTVPLIGFCGGPFTVSRYMKTTELQKLTDASIAYLEMQADSGVDAVQIFDSWAGNLSPEEFKRHSLPYLKQMIDALKKKNIPVILFCRGSCRYAKELASLGPTAISFDWEMPISTMRAIIGPNIAIQGNLDPEILKKPLELIEIETIQMLTSMQGDKGYIVNLGHGVLPDTPVEHIKYFIDLIGCRKTRFGA